MQKLEKQNLPDSEQNIENETLSIEEIKQAFLGSGKITALEALELVISDNDLKCYNILYNIALRQIKELYNGK